MAPQPCVNQGALAAFATDLANTSTNYYSTCCSPCYVTRYRVPAAALTEAATVLLLISVVKRKPKLVAVTCARFDRLPAAQLPPLWLVYSNNPSDSGAVHSPVKSRWLVDLNVRREMAQVAALAEQGRYGPVRCHVTLSWCAIYVCLGYTFDSACTCMLLGNSVDSVLPVMPAEHDWQGLAQQICSLG